MSILIEAARFPQEEEAIVAVTFLQARGLHARLPDNAQAARNAGYAHPGGFRVMVPESELRDAQELLAKVRNGE